MYENYCISFTLLIKSEEFRTKVKIYHSWFATLIALNIKLRFEAFTVKVKHILWRKNTYTNKIY